MDPYKKLRELLIRERTRAGLSQAALAAKLGKPQSYVSKCEQGERRVDVVEFAQMARALNCDVVALLQELIRSAEASGVLAATENAAPPIESQPPLKK